VRSDTSPLLAHEITLRGRCSPRGEAIPAWRFLADAAQLAERLPAGKHVLNVCSDGICSPWASPPAS